MYLSVPSMPLLWNPHQQYHHLILWHLGKTRQIVCPYAPSTPKHHPQKKVRPNFGDEHPPSFFVMLLIDQILEQTLFEVVN